MKRVLFVAVALLAPGALVAVAQEPRPAQPAQPAQPKVIQPVQPVQPVQPRPVAVTAARMLQLEEEVETFEAQREARAAYVAAAEVALRAAELHLDRVMKAGAVGTAADTDQAKVGVEMAKAQLAIKKAELKEIDVKLKYAKKRLEDAKAGGVRQPPIIRPNPNPKVDPLPPNVRFVADEKAADELKAKLEKLTAEAAKKEADAKKAEAQLKAAEAELARVLDLAIRGIVAPGTIEKAEANVAAAKELVAKLAKERKALNEEIAAVKKKLAEIEK